MPAKPLLSVRSIRLAYWALAAASIAYFTTAALLGLRLPGIVPLLGFLLLTSLAAGLTPSFFDVCKLVGPWAVVFAITQTLYYTLSPPAFTQVAVVVGWAVLEVCVVFTAALIGWVIGAFVRNRWE